MKNYREFSALFYFFLFLTNRHADLKFCSFAISCFDRFGLLNNPNNFIKNRRTWIFTAVCKNLFMPGVTRLLLTNQVWIRLFLNGIEPLKTKEIGKYGLSPAKAIIDTAKITSCLVKSWNSVSDLQSQYFNTRSTSDTGCDLIISVWYCYKLLEYWIFELFFFSDQHIFVSKEYWEKFICFLWILSWNIKEIT